ncbi:MAG: hypothetical protein CL927_05215 [Deltaproteobacteria bacterium]|nr:hypothetical protein [Deltaproteobacteria bacterium]
MSLALAIFIALTASASEAPRPAGPPGAKARFAQSYMELVDSADAFELAAAVEARDTLLAHHGNSVERVGLSGRLAAFMALGEPFSTRRMDWWQGRMPEKGKRYVVVWWHPEQADSRRVVLGAQDIAQRHSVPVLAVIPNGTETDRAAAAGLIAICPAVTFAAASPRILQAVNLDLLPQVSVVESDVVLWHGDWEDLARTPMHP